MGLDKSAWHHISGRTGVQSDWSVSGSPVIRPSVELNTEFFLRSRPLRQPAGHRLGRPTGLLAPQSRVGINVGSAMRWDPAGNRRRGQKKHSDEHKGKRIAGADIV